MKELNMYPLSHFDDIAAPEKNTDLSLESPALLFLIDFSKHPVFTIDSTLTAIEARDYMTKFHIQVEVVINKNNEFLGIVSNDELIERRIVQRVSEGVKRNEIEVTDFMKPKIRIKALAINELINATIADVINALRKNGESYCLAIDHNSNKIRGLFSAKEIAKMLNMTIDLPQIAPSFSSLMSHIN